MSNCIDHNGVMKRGFLDLRAAFFALCNTINLLKHAKGVFMQPSFPHPEVIGSFHQFGAYGVSYQVLRPVGQTEKGWLVEIEIPESGEHLEYNLDDVMNDPEAE